jgi:hypothetical protein
MQPANLVDGGFIQDDAEDWWPVDSSLATMIGMAQDMTGSDKTWWLDVVSLATGSTGTYEFHMGESTATRNQTFRFDGTTDTVTATDHADLDIADVLSLSAVVNFFTWPTGDTYVVNKSGAYGLGARTTGGVETLFGYSYGASVSDTLRPDGDDTIIAWVPTGCGAAHYTCIDETGGGDDATTWLNTAGVTGSEIYDLGAGAVPADASINSVTVYYRAQYTATSGTLTPSLCFNSCAQVQAGTPQALTNSWVTYNEAITRPGGGAWAVSDLAGLQVRIELSPGGASQQGLTQVYVLVSYDPYVEVTGTTDDAAADLEAGTAYTVLWTYNTGTNAELKINAVSKGTDTTVGNIQSNASNVIVGASINGYVDTVSINGSGTEYLAYDFEPDEVAETQQGDSGNSWVWTGTVEDVSAGGSDHDGTYSLTRDMADITTWTSNLRTKAVSVVSTAESTTDILGTTSVDPMGSQGESQFPFRDVFEGWTDHADLGITQLAAWYLMATSIGLCLAFAVWKATSNVVFAAIPWAGMYWLAWLVGSPIQLWLPLMASLVTVGLVFGGKQFSRA